MAVLFNIWEQADVYHIDRNRIFIGGDSAGGNMAAVVAMMNRDKGTHYLCGQVLIYAKLTFTNNLLEGYQRDLAQIKLVEEEREFFDMVTPIGSDEANAQDAMVYLQSSEDITDPYVSPVFGKKEGLPETLFIQAEYDGIRLEGEFYARQLAKAGVGVKMIRYRGVNHGFFDKLGILPQTESAVHEIATFIAGRK